MCLSSAPSVSRPRPVPPPPRAPETAAEVAPPAGSDEEVRRRARTASSAFLQPLSVLNTPR